VPAGRLTPYQAGALVQGKTKGLLIGNYRRLNLILAPSGQFGKIGD
jgi:hypothetical protein